MISILILAVITTQIISKLYAAMVSYVPLTCMLAILQTVAKYIKSYMAIRRNSRIMHATYVAILHIGQYITSIWLEVLHKLAGR